MSNHREGKSPMKKLSILNLGAGVQSTALYLMSLRQDEPESVPLFDYAIFADTQEEPDEVYRHLDWLESQGGPKIIRATYGKLGDDLINGHHFVTRKETAKYRPGEQIAQVYGIPSFLKSADGRVGLARRKCTSAYKINVINSEIRRLLGVEPGRPVPSNLHVTQYFGLSYDEPNRVIKAMDRSKRPTWFDPCCPLFDMEMTRRDCLDYLRPITPHETPRSACSFCPFHSNEEWRRIRDTDPKSWARSIEIDDALRLPGSAIAQDFDASHYLHRSCVPLAEAPIDVDPGRPGDRSFGFAQECEGMCGL